MIQFAPVGLPPFRDILVVHQCFRCTLLLLSTESVHLWANVPPLTTELAEPDRHVGSVIPLPNPASEIMIFDPSREQPTLSINFWNEEVPEPRPLQVHVCRCHLHA